MYFESKKKYSIASIFSDLFRYWEKGFQFQIHVKVFLNLKNDDRQSVLFF